MSALSEEQIDLISARLVAAFKTEFAEVHRRLESIQKVVDIQVANTDDDRKDFAQMKTNQATIAQAQKELIDMVQTMSKRVSDRVVDQTNATIEKAADNVAESVEPALQRAMNKIKNGQPLLQKKHWWQFWKK